MNKLFIISCFAVLLFISCRERDDYVSVPEEVQGFKPVYYDTGTNINTLIFTESPKPLVNTGKIYTYKKYLFVGESGKGVHVYDNTDPSAPLPLTFINIPYNYDVSVKDSILYADTYIGLVAIDISSIPQIQVLKVIRFKTVIPPIPLEPDFQTGRFSRQPKSYFECIDENKGMVVDWELVTLKKPNCYLY